MAEGRGRPACWIAVILWLAGCAAGGPLATAPGPAPSGPTIAAANNRSVAASAWIPDRPRAVIVALHGYGDYGRSTFAAAAKAWSAAGIATIAPDQRGFGRNPSRGRWPGADALVADAGRYVEQARARFPCRPVVLLGHSMGGGVALAAAGRGARADGLVLAAPAIWGGDNLNPFYRLFAWAAALAAPERRYTGRGIVRIQASDNIPVLKALGRDPLYLRPPSARELMGLVRIVDRAEAAAPRAALPTLMLLGAKDQIVPNRTVRRVIGRIPGPRKVIEYPEGWHLLFRDLQARRVWKDVAGWVLARPMPACKVSKGS